MPPAPPGSGVFRSMCRDPVDDQSVDHQSNTPPLRPFRVGITRPQLALPDEPLGDLVDGNEGDDGDVGPEAGGHHP